ncbi:uncharacterized protein Dmoj_GI14929 [Drosophila mojavensis]|uniref:Uncharacterized protein n=1 Tax=Drosophila mojavensis TaxID=7230 RepID=B4L446_DROMO|nr:uncharacterized protein Dmoj_GI14929 [Drosophila mojavensis]
MRLHLLVALALTLLAVLQSAMARVVSYQDVVQHHRSSMAAGLAGVPSGQPPQHGGPPPPPPRTTTAASSG